MYAFFKVPDIAAAMAKVEELGGEAKSLDDSDENVAEFGRFALCKDDQGSSFGLHEPPALGCHPPARFDEARWA